MSNKELARELAEKQVSKMTDKEIGSYLNVNVALLSSYHRDLVIDLIEFEKLEALEELTNQIKVDINYYIDDNGNKIYDEDSMRESFESQLTNLKNN